MRPGLALAAIVSAIVGFSCVAADARAEEGKVSGYFIGDYYYVADSHDEALKNENGFQFRRIYMQYDTALDDAFSVRLRFEMNSASFPEEKKKLEPFVKHGYLE